LRKKHRLSSQVSETYQKLASETAKFSKELLTTKEHLYCKKIDKKGFKKANKLPKSRQEVHSLPLKE